MQVNILFDDMSVGQQTSMRQRGKSTRRKSSVQSRNYDMGSRNRTSMLPEVDHDRYRTGTKEEKGPLLNFVTASKRQMRQAIEQTAPMAQKFLDENMGGGSIPNYNNYVMPDFKSRSLKQHRPSAHSVAQSLRQPHSKVMESSQNLMADISDLLSQEPRRHEASQLVSPRGLSNVPSKVSLITDQNNTLSVTSPQNSQARLKTQMSHNSPTSRSVDMLRRELKQLNKWLDNREMQIRADLECETAADKILELNRALEQTFQTTMTQLRTKLPGGMGSPLDQTLNRIMSGLHESFAAESTQYKRKLHLQETEIKALGLAQKTLKAEYEKFKANEGVEAYFEKFQSITNRNDPEKGDKQLRDELISKVQEFIDHQIIGDREIQENIQSASQIQPSNVQSELMTLAMESAIMNNPTVQDNPMVTPAFETEKGRIFDGIMKQMQNEAEDVRRAIQTHQKKLDTKGIKIPTFEKLCGTQTFDSLKDSVIVNWKYEQTQAAQAEQEEKQSIRTNFLESEIKRLSEDKLKSKQIIQDIQAKLRKLDPDTNLDDLKERISQFLKKKLGKQAEYIMKDLNEQVLEKGEQVELELSSVESLQSLKGAAKRQAEIKMDEEELKMKKIQSTLRRTETLQNEVAMRVGLGQEAAFKEKREVSSPSKASSYLGTIQSSGGMSHSVSEKQVSAVITKSGEFVKKVSQRPSFLDEVAKSIASMKKSQESEVKSKADERQTQRSAIDIIDSESAISNEDSEKKKDEGEVKFEAKDKPNFLESGQLKQQETGSSKVSSGQEQEVKQQQSPMQQMGKKPFGIAAERQEKEEIYQQIQTIDRISTALQDFEGIDQVKENLDSIEALMSQINSKIPVSIDVFDKVSLITGNESEAKEQSTKLREQASQLQYSKEVSDAKNMQQKLKHIEEIQSIVAQTKQFLDHNADQVDDTIGKSQFLLQLSKVERAKSLVKDLPRPDDLALVRELSIKVTAIDQEIQVMLESMVKPPPTLDVTDLDSAKPETAQKSEVFSLQPAETPEKRNEEDTKAGAIKPTTTGETRVGTTQPTTVDETRVGTIQPASTQPNTFGVQEESEPKSHIETAISAVSQAAIQIKSFIPSDQLLRLQQTEHSQERPTPSMMRVKKILKDMDRAVEWMNQVKEHGGIQEAEAARGAADDYTEEKEPLQEAGPPVTAQSRSLASAQHRLSMEGTEGTNKSPRSRQTIDRRHSDDNHGELAQDSMPPQTSGQHIEGEPESKGRRTAQDVREIDDRENQFSKEKSLTNAVGPEEWQEDSEPDAPDHLSSQLEQELGLETQVAKIQQARGDNHAKARKVNNPVVSPLSKHSLGSGRQSPTNSSHKGSTKQKSQKKQKRAKDKANFLAVSDIEPVVEAAREAEESQLVKKKKSTRAKASPSPHRVNETIEEKQEVTSGNASSIQDQPASRTQVYRKAPEAVKSPRQNQRQSYQSKSNQRRSQTFQKHHESSKRSNQDIAEVVDKRTLNVRKSMSSKKDASASSTKHLTGLQHGHKQRNELAITKNLKDGTIKFRNEAEEGESSNQQRTKIQDMWQFEQTFSAEKDSPLKNNLYSTNGDQNQQFTANVGTDPPTVYINSMQQPDSHTPQPKKSRKAKKKTLDIRESGVPDTDYRRSSSEGEEENSKSDGSAFIDEQIRKSQNQATEIDQQYVHEVIVHPDINAGTKPRKAKDKNMTQTTLGQNDEMNGTDDIEQSSFDNKEFLEPEMILQDNVTHKINRQVVGRPLINIANSQQTDPEELQISRAARNEISRHGEYQIREKIPENAVLMLPQSTQTENKSLIKLLLGWINDAMMRQLEEQSINMTPEQFNHTLDGYKTVIPDVYNRVKDQSDTFFIQQQLGPNYNTSNVRLSEESPKLMPSASEFQLKGTQQQQRLRSPQYGSGFDLHMEVGQGTQTGLEQYGPDAHSLSPNPSRATLHLAPHQQSSPNIDIYDQSMKSQYPSGALSKNPSKMELNIRSKKHLVGVGQYLQLGDYSRYGNHTLELSKEISERVTVKQMGRVGGGYLGSVQKTIPDR